MKMLSSNSAALIATVGLALAAGCDKNATPGPAPDPVVARPTAEQGGAQANPHGDLGANPHGDLSANVHDDLGAADPQGGEMPNDDIHSGMRMPEAQFDPALALDGTIDVSPKLKDQVKAGDILFLFAKAVDPDTGKATGAPLAVDRLDVQTLPVPFHLDGGNVMIAGLKLEGNVVLFARVDRDGEARTREKGDVEGTLAATVPAKGLKIVLDTPVLQ